MDASKQRGSIVLTKQNIDGQDYIRIEYTDNQTIALLLSQDKGIKTIGNGSAYIQASTFQLPEFYTRYSPHAYIDYSRYMFVHPKPQREYVLPKGIWNYWNRSVTVPRQSRLTGFISVISWSITKGVTSTT